ncbi:heterokaryon incompatibility protein Het-C-domain-containing protein [Pisolithus croceorrhizus]|nr:heterokaryon incompatibility protein Het-C-domain-containing protein [Pisolithus croceorrhizus]
MSNRIPLFFVLFVVFAFCLSGKGVYAFGAGNIPSFAYMEGKAFRHGDIEDTLSELLKQGALGGFGLAALISKGTKFGGLDVKRVYFGNWLRDYSQAVDIGTLKKVNIQTIINLCMVLGFMAHGYATEEFEVTSERLGCYLPTEHIDNPKGYGDGEDARRYHPGLRGPVDPRELEIDPRTGMKNYIANENGNWDTSKAFVRRTLERCIYLGRQYRSTNNKTDQCEAFRLLGQALHTLEDFPAHSNFCELALVSQGHNQVFAHVGDSMRVQAPGGRRVAPLVTGTFGSMLTVPMIDSPEATDHLSEASVTDLNKEFDSARSKSRSSGKSPFNTLRDLFISIPGGSGSEMAREIEGVERIRAGPAQGGKRPEEMSPQEIHSTLWQVLSFKDSVMKKISTIIEKIPGLSALVEKISDSISVFVFTTVEPFVKPVLQTATNGLQLASAEVVNTHDQYEVFNDPLASDPTHSFLSKDHFNLILNEPAGHLAKIILIHTVNLVVKAWDDTSVNVHQVIEDVLQCLFHPDFHDPNSKIQREMIQYMNSWVQGLGQKREEVLGRLTKESVRAHRNTRSGGEWSSEGSGYAYPQPRRAGPAYQPGYDQSTPVAVQAQSLLGQTERIVRETRSESFDPRIPASEYAPDSQHVVGMGGAPSFPNAIGPYAPPPGPPFPHKSSHAPGSVYTPSPLPMGGPSFLGVDNTPDPAPRMSSHAPPYMNTSSRGGEPSFSEGHGQGPAYYLNSSSVYASRHGHAADVGFPSVNVPSGGGPAFPGVTHAHGGETDEFRDPSPGRGHRHESHPERYQYGHQHQPYHHSHGSSYGRRQ